MSQYQSKGGRREAQHKKAGKSAGSSGPRKGASSITGRGGAAQGIGPSSSTPSVSSIVSVAAPTPSLASVASTNQNDKEANGAAASPRGAATVGTTTNPNQMRSALVSQKDGKQQQQSGTLHPSVPVVKQSSPSAESSLAEPAFTFQFGSISPGFIHHTGMQIPARTNSAPPNLDEQRRKQAASEKEIPLLVDPHHNHVMSHGAASLNSQSQARTQVSTQSTNALPTVSTMQLPHPEESLHQSSNFHSTVVTSSQIDHTNPSQPVTSIAEKSSRYDSQTTFQASNDSGISISKQENVPPAINDSLSQTTILSDDKPPLVAKEQKKKKGIDAGKFTSNSSGSLSSKVASKKASKSQPGIGSGSEAKDDLIPSPIGEGLPPKSIALVDTIIQSARNLSITSESNSEHGLEETRSCAHVDISIEDSSIFNQSNLLKNDSMTLDKDLKSHLEVLDDSDELPNESGLSNTSTDFKSQNKAGPVLKSHSEDTGLLQADDPPNIEHIRMTISDKNYTKLVSTAPDLGRASVISDMARELKLEKIGARTFSTLDAIDTDSTQVSIAIDPMEAYPSSKISSGIISETAGKPSSNPVGQSPVSYGKLGHKHVEEHSLTSLKAGQPPLSVDVGSASKHLDSVRTVPVANSVHMIDRQASAEQGGSSLVEQQPLCSNSSHAVQEAKQGSKKKKKKELLAKADAAGSTADLYNAYKAPEDKRRDDAKPIMQPGANFKEIKVPNDDFEPLEKNVSKELDDWEDAAELPTPNTTFISGKDALLQKGSDMGNHVNTMNKYTRDFLLTFRDQSLELPFEFRLHPSLGGLVLTPEATASLTAREASLNLERSLDHQSSTGSQLERRGSLGDEDRWAKLPGVVPTAGSLDFRGDISLAAPYSVFRPGQNANIGLIARMPPGLRLGMPVPPPMTIGHMPGPPPFVHVMGLGPVPRPSGVDADRWERAPSSQKGLIPSPQTPLPTIHKAENKYEIGKVSDEEQLKQRQIKAILNKLTPQNFDRLFEQVKEVKIETAATLREVISQIFDKALMEPTFCEMYAKFCVQLAQELPEFNENGVKVTFRRVLLNKCQEEFERGEREQEEAEKEEDGQIILTKEEREEKKVRARRRMLGNIRFIGELYKKSMLTERIMHECIKKLLGEYQNPEEEDIEALCKLMTTIGRIIDHPKAKAHLDAYFDRMNDLSSNKKLSSRLRFMLKDVIDLRRNGWQERRKVEGPKKIDEVHRDAAQERQGVSNRDRMTRVPSMGGSNRRPVSMNDFPTRGPGPFLSAPIGAGLPFGVRGVQGGPHGPYGQDFRMDDRSVMESRTMPMPLMQKLNDEGTFTLVPQGGLGRGFGIRSQPPAASGRSALADVPSVMLSDSRRAGVGPIHSGLNAGMMTDRGVYGGRHHEDFPLRPSSADRMHLTAERSLLERPYTSDRYGPSYGRDLRGIDRSFSDRSISMPSRPGTPPSAVYSHSVPSSPQLPSEQDLIKRCKLTMLEYYSARDLKEAAQCVDDLKAPQFHSRMVSIWVSDTLEKKDIERDCLVGLLIYLRRMERPLLTREHLVQGFQSVLHSLEDTMFDVPRAPSYLAGIIGKLLAQGVVSLGEVGKLLKEGGMEHGSLLETGDAFNMLVDVLDTLRKERGEATMLQIYEESGLVMEDFLGKADDRIKKLDEVLERRNLQVLHPVRSWPV
ncbi:hypothetical protein O6H91_20G066900 [Diphasiastrum complanatum]|uniref:Uncharacterized protein n=1 Tax=Diphasiastrum complanatum TaxID=34168 RepID=A0ACC2ARF5_DIPCM|nr:hypothetical protein O6H91_20G066900 [Diphasiastrum complanatum]